LIHETGKRLKLPHKKEKRKKEVSVGEGGGFTKHSTSICYKKVPKKKGKRIFPTIAKEKKGKGGEIPRFCRRGRTGKRILHTGFLPTPSGEKKEENGSQKSRCSQ